MNKIVDEKFKDASPESTVARIRNILSSNGLTVTEDWCPNSICNCYALRLTLDGTSFGTNGKGVTEALARASAYAELMERLQTGMLGADARIHFADAQQMDRNTAKQNVDVLFERLSGIVKDFDDIDVPADCFLDAAFGFEGTNSTITTIPFYNITDDKMVAIPRSMLIPLYSSTGLAAGNTPEEAIVQGLSEIVERWCQRHFLCKDMVPPTIPDVYLQQYPMAWETICQVRNSGYDVIVKDCSMGLGWPAIATVVIDKKTHAYHVHMGASPVFAIALGRSLTETFQGRVIQTVADTYLTESSKNVTTYRKSFVKGRGAYPIQYFTDESTYPFVPFPDRSGCSNKELLQYAIDYFASNGMKVYIRDMSHFGFPTFQIIVPDICISPFDVFTSPMNVPQLVGSTRPLLTKLKQATPDQLFEIQLLNFYQTDMMLLDHNPKCSALLHLPATNNPREDTAIGYMHLAYVDWACGNREQAYKHAYAVEQLHVPDISDYCSCLCRLREMTKQGVSADTALNRLGTFYEDTTIAEIRKAVSAKENPFAAYVVDCGQGSENCEKCRYAKTCSRENDRKIGILLNKYARVFDNDKAFAELRNLFQSLK